MKKVLTILAFIFVISFSARAQTSSYRALKGKFIDYEDVHSFSLGGWACRLILNLSEEGEFKEAIEDVDHVRMITIPKSHFEAEGVSLNGFKKVLSQDAFEELAQIKEENSHVTVYLKENSVRNNYYFVIIEEDSEVVAIELKGYLNPEVLRKKSSTAAL